MLFESLKQINKTLIFKTLTHLLYCIKVSHRPCLSGIPHAYKCFRQCSPAQEGKPCFQSKVTFSVRLSPFLESEICYLKRQEFLEPLKLFHDHKREQFSSKEI